MLSQLTSAPKPSQENFTHHMEAMRNSRQKHLSIVGIDVRSGRVIAFGTVLVCLGALNKKAKIENIVTCRSVRGKGLGKNIIEILKWLAFE